MDISATIQRFGYGRLQKLLGVPYGTVTSWKARGHVPSRFWVKLVEEAQLLGIEGVSLAGFAEADAQRPRQEHAQKVAA